jgi:hypothetical protein
MDSRHGRTIIFFLLLVLLAIMADMDLNQPINWDELDDFDGEARELAGDFFFEVESDEGKLLQIIRYLFDVWVD